MSYVIYYIIYTSFRCQVRTQETNLGNFVADIMLKCVNADIALINSGTLRYNVIRLYNYIYNNSSIEYLINLSL